jgi:hypothetical protein
MNHGKGKSKMTIQTWQKIAGAAAVTIGLGMLGNSAHATSRNCGGPTPDTGCYTWTFDSSTDIAGVNGQPGNTINATASGWANTGGAGNTLLQSAYVVSYNGAGLGVTNKDCNTNYGAGPCTGGGGDTNEGSSSSSPPEHTVDNSDRVDSILFNFGATKVNLTTFSAGYVYGDSDFTVLAYVGDDFASNQTDPTNLSYGELLSHGWKLIGNYAADSSTGSHSFAYYNNGTTTENDTYSSLWMIGALNTLAGIGGVQDSKIDAFKILSVAGCKEPPKGAPEPGTLLLMGAGLFGLTRIRAQRAVRCAA